MILDVYLVRNVGFFVLNFTLPSLISFNLVYPSHEDGVGVPTKSNISPICSISVFPGRIGLPSINSARMHPADHMSTDVPYSVDPSRISGGRYHSVITLFVSCFTFPSLLYILGKVSMLDAH